MIRNGWERSSACPDQTSEEAGDLPGWCDIQLDGRRVRHFRSAGACRKKRYASVMKGMEIFQYLLIGLRVRSPIG